MTRYQLLLLDDFSALGVSLLSEPMFLANWLLARKAYSWTLLSMDGAAVRASSGVLQPVDGAADEAPNGEPLFVIASFDGKAVALLRQLFLNGVCSFNEDFTDLEYLAGK